MPDDSAEKMTNSAIEKVMAAQIEAQKADQAKSIEDMKELLGDKVEKLTAGVDCTMPKYPKYPEAGSADKPSVKWVELRGKRLPIPAGSENDKLSAVLITALFALENPAVDEVLKLGSFSWYDPSKGRVLLFGPSPDEAKTEPPEIEVTKESEPKKNLIIETKSDLERGDIVEVTGPKGTKYPAIYERATSHITVIVWPLFSENSRSVNSNVVTRIGSASKLIEMIERVKKPENQSS